MPDYLKHVNQAVGTNLPNLEIQLTSATNQMTHLMSKLDIDYISGLKQKFQSLQSEIDHNKIRAADGCSDIKNNLLPKMDDEHNKVYGHLEALKREISSNIQEKL